MRFPTVPVQRASRQMTDVFGGYNHNLRINDGEFFDMRNMTSDYYPVLAPRKKRGFYTKVASPQGLIAKDELCYVDGAEFVIGDTRYDMGLSVEDSMCPKQLTSMGAYVIIMPDKKYINTMDPEDRGAIEAGFDTAGEVTFQLCSVNGEIYEGVTQSKTEPENPTDSQLWLDTGSSPHSLKKYSGSTAVWVSIASTYIRIGAAGIGANFRQYDAVNISGVTDEALQDLNASMVIWAKEDDWIVVTGILDENTSQEGSLSLRRQMPNMDFLCESNNRLWGCRYGTALNGEFVNEIYCCKLGDFRNWSCYMGISTDSYAASCGTDGPFTGAAAPQGRPTFFKENCMHEIYGNYPANFQIQMTPCRGVQEGCHGSLAVVNEVLYYKSRSGICAFDGSLPEEVSFALGNQVFSRATGGAHGNKYYVSMMDIDGDWHLFVYDTIKKLWHREDNLHVSAFCSYRDEMYAVDADTDNIITLLGSGTPAESKVEWMVETGDLGLGDPGMKYVSGVIVRMQTERGTEVNIYVQYELDGEWLHVCNIHATSLRSCDIPIRPRRADHMRLRIEAKGGGKLYSITRKITQGSERS